MKFQKIIQTKMIRSTTKLVAFIFIILIQLSASIEMTGANIDSLKTELNISNKGSQLLILETLTNELLRVDNNEALKFATQGLALAISQKDSLQSVFYDYLGEINRQLGNYKEAVAFIEKGLILKKETNNPKNISISYNKIGKVYVNTGEYDLAISNFMAALELMKEADNKEGKAFYLNNIGVVYDFQSMYKKALKFYEASLEIKKELNNEAGIAATTNNIAIIYYNLKDYEKSLSYHLTALELNKKLNRTNSISGSYNNVGFALIFLNRNKEALDYLNKGLEIRKQLHDNPGIANSLNNIARALFNLEKYTEAKQMALEGLQMAETIEANELIKDSYLILSEIEERNKSFYKSLNYFKKYVQLQDTLLNISNSEILAEVEAKYQNEKKEVELKKQELTIQQKDIDFEKESSKKRMVGILLLASLITLSLVIYGYFQKRRISILLKAQNILIGNKNDSLKQDNSYISKELEDKLAILSKVYSDKKEIELPPELLSLSTREMEVLSILALGWTDQQIADKLFLSKATIKSHLRRIYSKLLVKSRTEAVTLAHRFNIIGNK